MDISKTDPAPETHLPLRPVVFTLLSLLSQGPLHGYLLMQRANDSLGQRALLGPGTLYRVLKELRDQRFIEETEPPAETGDEPPDRRRRYYRLTERGRQVTHAEARRLSRLLRSLPYDAKAERSPT